MSRFCWSRRFGHRFEHSAQITVGGDDSGGVFLERGTHDIEAAQEGIKFLRIGGIEGCGINGGGFRVGFAFDLERVLRRSGTDRCNVAFFLAANIRSFTTAFGTEARGGLMSFAPHPFNDFLATPWLSLPPLTTSSH